MKRVGDLEKDLTNKVWKMSESQRLSILGNVTDKQLVLSASAVDSSEYGPAKQMSLLMTPGSYPAENSFKIIDSNGVEKFNQQEGSTFDQTETADLNDGMYTIEMTDSWGDSWNGGANVKIQRGPYSYTFRNDGSANTQIESFEIKNGVPNVRGEMINLPCTFTNSSVTVIEDTDISNHFGTNLPTDWFTADSNVYVDYKSFSNMKLSMVKSIVGDKDALSVTITDLYVQKTDGSGSVWLSSTSNANQLPVTVQLPEFRDV